MKSTGKRKRFEETFRRKGRGGEGIRSPPRRSRFALFAFEENIYDFVCSVRLYVCTIRFGARIVIPKNEWKEEGRRIECIFGNKYNLNELAVNWKWAIQGYLTRGLPLAPRLSYPTARHLAHFHSVRLDRLRLRSYLVGTFSLTRGAVRRAVALRPISRRFPSADPSAGCRSKRYFREGKFRRNRGKHCTWSGFLPVTFPRRIRDSLVPLSFRLQLLRARSLP